MKRSRKRRTAKISDAVFRGRKAEYTFEVYPFVAEIKDSPAVFIFSRRKLNKNGHASHAASCIGETDSILAELKKHKRAKCIKQNEGNVVCILRDDSDKNRAAVLSDITDARTFSCIRGLFEPTMLRKPNVHTISATKFAKFVPSPALPLKPIRRKRVAANPVQAVDESKGAKAARASAVAADGKRASAKPKTAAAKPAKTANGKAKASKATPKRTAAKPRTRVQSRVDRDRGQHRLSNQKGTVRGRAKARAAGKPGARKKAAA